MKVSYKWLRDVAPGLDLSVESAMEHLALRGAPVEEVVALAAGLEDIVVARVIESGKHPNADRLSLCRVEGPGGEVQVVCGAPNVEAGAFYPFAPVGAVLPGDFRIERRKIRGEYSEGMLCSETELGLGSDSDGIMKLEGDLEVGIPLTEALGLDDVRLDVEITANRGDMLSHVGIVRELHPDGVHAIRLPEVPGGTAPAPGVRGDPNEASSAGVTIRIEDPDLCFRYLGLVIRGVEVGPSPDWLASRIRAAGGRPINNVVDATNYVLLELGQPLHAFDVARLEGPDIVVRRARAGEELRTLDGEDRPITEDMLMICDAERPVAIAGVMGGQDSEVTESTSDVLLECALFEPKQIRATRRALGMSTDASYRYERGVDPEAMETAILRTAEILLATAGGSVDGELIDVHPRPWSQPVVPLRPSRIEHLLGIPFTKERIAELLRPLGYSVADEDEDLLQVSVPGFRSYDTLREVDLIEEVARTHGYDAFPEELGPYRPGTVPDHPLFRLEDDLRRALVAEGLSEAQTPSLGPGEHGDVALANPMSMQESHLRRNRLAGLLTHVERNLARGTRDVRLFEIGTGFAPGDPRPVETARVAIAVTGSRSPVHWSTDRQPYDVYDIGHLLGVVGSLAIPGSRIVASQQPHPDFEVRASYDLVTPGGGTVGRGGVIAADRLDVPPWAGPVLGLEVVLPPEPEPLPAVTALPPPSQPSSSRDIAFLVPEDVGAGAVIEAIRKAGTELLESVDVFDLYQGDDLPAGMRSIAYALRFRARDRTLTDEEVDGVVRAILKRIKKDTGVEPRG